MAENRVSDHVCNALALVLADAKRGAVEAVAIVHVGADGIPRVSFGGAGDLAPSINLGADMLKASLLQQGSKAQMNSGLVVPGQG